MNAPIAASDQPRFVTAYTVYLFVLGGLAVMMVFSHEMLISLSAADGEDQTIRIILRLVQAIEVVVAVFATLVGCLRVYRARLAPVATAAVSILLIAWLPFGTAAFVWWVGWIRKRERVAFA